MGAKLEQNYPSDKYSGNGKISVIAFCSTLRYANVTAQWSYCHSTDVCRPYVKLVLSERV